MDAMGILLTFAGILVHDHWKSYFAYAAVHVLCNAHHLRELQGVVDRDANKLALRLMKLLTLSWHFCKKYKAAGLTQMPGAIQLRIEKIYDQNLQRALTKEAAYMEKQRQVLGRKKVRNTKAYNLFKRLIEFKVETLRFMSTFQFPSITMAVNVMPGWPNLSRRSQAASEAKTEGTMFTRIRSYLSSAKKQGLNIFQALLKRFEITTMRLCWVLNSYD